MTYFACFLWGIICGIVIDNFFLMLIMSILGAFAISYLETIL